MKYLAVMSLIIAGCSAQAAPQREDAWVDGVVDTAGAIPSMPREARGVWIATVGNMDWPSRRGLPTDSQKAELRAILDRVKQLNMNLVIFQVRPAGDALYASALEPWSEYLTGTQGKAPDPYYDPLAFAIEEAHARGLELHAWFNPYRARHPSGRSDLAPLHLGRSKPELVRKYGEHLWMDPGEPAVQAHSLKVIGDVVKNYDVDGIHIDDYFYPYREYRRGKLIQFPDERSWRKYVNAGGKLTRDDWRRDNVDQFVRRLHETVHAIKPNVKFGISPFGIWRPGHPESVRGLDAYVELFADSRKWLNNGWLDYFTPQLYWQTESPQQRYTALLDWWVAENKHNRHIWAGNAAFRVRRDQQNWAAEEIVRQVVLTREQRGASGNVQFNMTSLMKNQGGVADALSANAYPDQALMPRFSWLDDEAPPVPHIRVDGTTLEIAPAPGEQPFVYAVRMKVAESWRAEILPANQARYEILRAPGVLPEMVGVTAVDRNGNESAAVMVTLSDRARP